MKATGMVRKMDDLGRLVIPSELRKVFDFGASQEIEIFIEGKNIILSKHCKKCIICNNSDELMRFDDKFVCNDCVSRIGQIV